MRALVQRVSRAAVDVGDERVGQIGAGLLVLLGVKIGDEPQAAVKLAQKVAGLRIFADAEDKMNASVTDIGGEVLVVSQFTLYGDCRKGRRPNFMAAAPPETARPLYETFIAALEGLGVPVAQGRFGARMALSLVNDGPVTLLVESD